MSASGAGKREFSGMAGTVWDAVLGRIETKVNRHSYYTWFRQTSLASDDGGRLVVRVTDPMAVDWLQKHYSGIIDEALVEVGRPGVTLEFRPESTDGPPKESLLDVPVERPAPDIASVDHEPAEVVDLAGLSPRYSFETFIVGASNQFAHAACRAVAEAPSRSYNPLFLYGGVGLGKTHLMHAIGHY